MDGIAEFILSQNTPQQIRKPNTAITNKVTRVCNLTKTIIPSTSNSILPRMSSTNGHITANPLSNLSTITLPKSTVTVDRVLAIIIQDLNLHTTS